MELSSSDFAPTSSTPLVVLYEDNHVIAVFKTAGTLTQADSSGEASLMDHTKAWLKSKYGKPGQVFLGLVHRLDKPVAGIVLFGKTSKGASRLSEQFRTRKVRKIYWGLVEGRPPAQAELQDYLEDGVPPIKAFSEAGPTRKLCNLSYRTLRTFAQSSLLEIELGTGRKHQIRVQFSHRGHPLLGDVRYGSRLPGPRDGIALVAKRVEFQHPIRQEETICLEVPEALCPLVPLLK